MTARDERDARTQFSARYSTPAAAIAAAIERRVIGAAWGANGYTTREQADELGRLLGLSPARALLDVGTGRGWPGLYLAKQSGCRVVATDMPLEGLRIATRRAAAEDIADRTSLVVAGGARQPFRDRSFDAIALTDVLC
jgi:predicted O-methyltransferase YrrM